MFTATTRNRYNFFDVSSAFQKSVRRGLLHDALYCAAELDDSGLGNSVFTKLKVFCVEDVSLANPLALFHVHRLHKLWKKDKQRKFVMDATSLVAYGKKSRVSNTVLGVTAVRPTYATDLLTTKDLLTLFTNSLNAWERVAEGEMKGKDEVYWNVLTSAYRLHTLVSTSKPEGGGSVKDMWKVILDYTKRVKPRVTDLMIALEACFSEAKFPKNRMFWSMGVLLLLLDDYSWEKCVCIEVDPDKFYDPELKRDVMHDYVFDKHTRKGKTMGRGIAHFRDVGSLIMNEGYPDLYKKEFFEVYMEYEKKGLKVATAYAKALELQVTGTFKLERVTLDSLFSELRLTQLPCGGKPPVNFSRFKLAYMDKDVVVKGPLKKFPQYQINIDKKKEEHSLRPLNFGVVQLGDKFYLMSDTIPNSEKLCQYLKEHELSDLAWYELLKILLFRNKFRISDMNHRNVIITKDGKDLYSLDEMGEKVGAEEHVGHRLQRLYSQRIGVAFLNEMEGWLRQYRNNRFPDEWVNVEWEKFEKGSSV